MALALLLPPGVCAEPWARCSPDAFWLRRVIARARFMAVGDTGSALSFVARCGPPCGPAGEWNVWAAPGTRRHPVYRLVRRVDGRVVYGDGVRIVWIVQKRAVWLSVA